ncbi:MAG: hypothetical protein UR39_C0002G0088 [Candidatus Woesebacteria bacterium GW2011_GWA1_33_30]|uniref:Uncharacterized protein n=1 Tax=Candidatus Woesebacteria bacterium GW2011_GWA2_33_28 TaxID=1618561 RepID=A0A0G0C9X4_9BACT|nr:MAG: hypothetical protein UR38_C0002G0088 [Candidatus Woesebacteria bacterium GW2011_GWA2_33_28]KKP48798.1 MAG: hypothetical protein UR39_C0002G0088 [Candidatus Woesebacteria bacterium GW2011_GWA1_33_30]KKP50071.1 MAG: hypothetical protein UR40_C0002G0088 [Microgenomates group bacterium GW2011_GWC1_33_32]KKP51842.1 MAG: hypothetical protein UR44_C0006G0088 [Candidatus Woesebacteria bacterium GW2011_GWB1_33_38]
MNIFRCRELKIKCKKLPTKGSYNKQTLYLISYIYFTILNTIELPSTVKETTVLPTIPDSFRNLTGIIILPDLETVA